MLVPNCDITITNNAGKTLVFDFVRDVEIVSTWREQTNTAKIVLPRKVSTLATDAIADLIQVGNEVNIKLGYDGDLNDEFHGYIRSIGSGIPLEIECEDLMWKLKQEQCPDKTYKKTTLAEVISHIVPSGIKTSVTQGINLGSIRFTKVSVAKALQQIKEQYPFIVSYVRKDVLCVGFVYPVSWRSDPKYTVHYHFQKNIIENDLKYKGKKDVKVKIEAISKQSNGTNQKYFYPDNDPNAELHTLHAGNGLGQSDLKKFAQMYYDQFLYNGYKDTLKCFGDPWCDHGFVAELEDDIYPERAGRFLVDRVVTRFGIIGYKRELTLGGKV